LLVTTADLANLALANVNGTACGTNSLGGNAFESSCTGNGGQPEYWCADFVKWVWRNGGADVSGLTAAAGSFYVYGQNNGTLSNNPAVGDAVVFDYGGGGYADHVAIVTRVYGDGTIETASGDWNGDSGSEAQFASTSHVLLNDPPYPGAVGTYPGPIGMRIDGFIAPLGLGASPGGGDGCTGLGDGYYCGGDGVPGDPNTLYQCAGGATVSSQPCGNGCQKNPGNQDDACNAGAEGSQAFVVPNQQHYFSSAASGDLKHAWWDASVGAVSHDTWGRGIAGNPSTFVTGSGQQHAFARGSSGSLEHWYWDAADGIQHDTWAQASAIASDPAATLIGDFEDIWAVDGGGNLQHWFWGPNTGSVQHDTWGAGVVGRPSVLLYGAEQHAFARGNGGTLEHWWWAPGTGISHDVWGSGIAGDPAALTIGQFQDVWAVDGGGNVQHWYWGPAAGGVQHDTWGAGAVGRPSVIVDGAQQHVFARGTGGTLEHWWWDPSTGVSHDTWGSGITADPTALLIANQQHVWAQDAAGHTQHWYWDPSTGGVSQDDWGQ
jgi:hypothetical protein